MMKSMNGRNDLRGLATMAVVFGVAACAPAWPLDEAPSPAPATCVQTDSPTLLAGVGRADITPPPGLGLQGYGTEGRPASGYRQRLYARALVLQTGRERVAFVVADLPQVSTILHRATAAKVDSTACIGEDRLMLSATHTHAGPGHFFTARLINDAGSQVSGFDPQVVEFLVDRFASALGDAVANLKPAVAGWKTDTVWGLTRNRAYEAFRRNRQRPSMPVPDATTQSILFEDRDLAVDPVMSMLRVDHVRGADTVPIETFTVFAIHGTGNPSYNDLFDGDIHALVERGLERHIDAVNGRTYDQAGPPVAVHLFANGTEGDVSPAWPELRERPLCPAPTLGRARPTGGPRAPVSPVVWRDPPVEAVAHCMAFSRKFIKLVGDSLAARAIALFDSFGPRELRDDLIVARAFSAKRLPEEARRGTMDICEEPRQGTAVLGGGADGRSRYHKWKILGLISAGFDEDGGGIAYQDVPCQTPKRIAAGNFLQQIIVGGGGLPELGQFMVARVGDRLVGALPWEVTTVAGLRIKAAMRDSTGGRFPDPILVSLANGYFQYLTTEEEYSLQRYEGGSNLYGKGTAAAVAIEMGALSAAAKPGFKYQPRGYTAYPGPHKDLFPRPERTQPPSREILPPRISANGDTVVIRWTDAWPGDLIPADGPLLHFLGGSGNFETWDDDPDVEVRAIGRRSRDEFLWEVRWTACSPGPHVLELLPRKFNGQLLAVKTLGFRC